MSVPESCPYCGGTDVRSITVDGLDVAAYRCPACVRVFYVAAVHGPPPRVPVPPGETDDRHSRGR